jgi:hypothetical protein
MEIVQERPPFKRRIKCSCHVILEAAEADLRCALYRASDMPDWYKIFVVCPRCEQECEVSPTDMPKPLRQRLIDETKQRIAANAGPGIWARIKAKLFG